MIIRKAMGLSENARPILLGLLFALLGSNIAAPSPGLPAYRPNVASSGRSATEPDESEQSPLCLSSPLYYYDGKVYFFVRKPPSFLHVPDWELRALDAVSGKLLTSKPIKIKISNLNILQLKDTLLLGDTGGLELIDLPVGVSSLTVASDDLASGRSYVASEIPCVTDDSVYVGMDNGLINVLDRYSFKSRRTIALKNHGSESVRLLVAKDEKIFGGLTGVDASYVFELDCTTGTLGWCKPIQDYVDIQPSVVGGLFITGQTSQRNLTLFDTRTGNEVMSFENVYGHLVSGHLLFVNQYQSLDDMSKDGVSLTVFDLNKRNKQGEPEKLWQNTSLFLSEPVSDSNGVLYASYSDSDKKSGLIAIAGDTGKTIWTSPFDTGRGVENPIKVGDGLVFCLHAMLAASRAFLFV